MNTTPPPQDQLPPASPNPATAPGLPLPLGKPFWVYVLLGLIVIVFIIESSFPVLGPMLVPLLPAEYSDLSRVDLSGGSTNTIVLMVMGANYRPLVLEGQVWRFFTSMFLHIGLQHLLFNAYALFIFGAEMERVFGKARFITIYILAGLFGSLASFALHANPTISAGASGAIFGVVGMQVAYFQKYKTILGEFGRSRLMNIGFIVALNLFFGITMPGIDNLAHVGGLISGATLAYWLSPVYQVTDRYTDHPRVIDKASFVSQIWVPLVGLAILVAGTIVAINWAGMG